MIAVAHSRNKGLSVQQIYKCIQLNRDAFYKCRRRFDKREVVESKVIELVKKERNIQARVGTRKLHKKLQDTFLSLGINVGRDRLFNILRTKDLLVKRKKVSYKTTNSYHHF